MSESKPGSASELRAGAATADSIGHHAGSDLPEIEGYDIIEAIDRGGMGVVYEAYQQSTGRRVAIKFMLESARANESARRRFEREVELASRITHPGIVSVLDSGLHRGNYYYVMEYVDGRTLDAGFPPGACEVRSILALFVRICEIVDYAHQRGVLHRDLKPANILITDAPTVASKLGKSEIAGIQPKILDFGLAKAFDPSLSDPIERSLSQPGQLIGTLGYMSPEQSRGEWDQISVRSDVYSLGAIAYELITGRLPVDIGGALVDALGRIVQTEPAPPSSFQEGISVDLDAVLLKCLSKAPADRYATPMEFAADIERVLADEPVRARRIGRVARAGRWVRRHRAMSVAAGVAIALVLGLTITYVAKIRAERDWARRYNATLEGIFTSFDLDQPGIDRFTAKDFLEHAANRLEHDGTGNPEVEVDLRHTVGIIYIKRGQYEQAEHQFRRIIDLQRDLRSSKAEVATTKLWLAASWWNQSRFAEAETLYREVLEIRRSVFSEGSLEVAEANHHLAAAIDSQNRHEEAEKLLREALAVRTQELGPAHEDTVSTLGFLGNCLRKQKRFDAAGPELQKALEITRAHYGPSNWRTARSLKYLAEFNIEIGEFDKAEELAAEALAIQMKIDKDSPDARASRALLDQIRESKSRNRLGA